MYYRSCYVVPDHDVPLHVSGGHGRSTMGGHGYGG